jgi:hypothetical protein
MRTIMLEEHFASPACLEGPGKGIKEQSNNPEHPMAKIFGQLADLGGQRIAAMDAAGIDVQALSLNSPGGEQIEPADAVAVACDTNDCDQISKPCRLTRLSLTVGNRPSIEQTSARR